MSRNINQIQLQNIQFPSEPQSPIKPHLKILMKKLPQDFFTGSLGINSCTSVIRNPERQPPTTSSFPRKTVKQQYVARDVLTAKDYGNNKEQQLIMGVLKSAREMKKVFRKHSVELKNEKIIKKRQNQFDLQLPPLLLKKGITFAY